MKKERNIDCGFPNVGDEDLPKKEPKAPLRMPTGF